MKVNYIKEFEYVDMDRWFGYGIEDVVVFVGIRFVSFVGGDDEEGEGVVL